MKTYEPRVGDTIHRASVAARDVAYLDGQPVQFRFNGIELIVYPYSFATDICTIYSLKCRLLRYEKGLSNENF